MSKRSFRLPDWCGRFSDLVASTQRAAKLGDANWKRQLDRHDRIATSCIAQHGIQFQDRGQHELKGVPGTWHLHTVVT